MARRRMIPPFETELTHLAKGGVAVGATPEGREVHVRGSAPGAVVHITPMGVKKGIVQGRRTGLVSAAPDAVEPKCAVFGLCGGCVLQELPVARQRQLKTDLAVRQIETSISLEGVTLHPARGSDVGFGYRNKVELSFGIRRYLSEEDHAEGIAIDGRFLGFHAPGRFDRVVDAERCELVSEGLNALIGTTRAVALTDDSPPPWDVRVHEGFWRHLILRQGFATGELLVGLVTSKANTSEQESAVVALAEALQATELPDGLVLAGVVWLENDGVADVARGVPRQVWGRDTLEERLFDVGFRLSIPSFFQTSTRGAEILYSAVGEAVGDAGGTLYDLYCGIGTIGQVLAGRFDRIVGVEEVEAAVLDARENARRNGIEGTTYRTARMREALDALQDESERRVLLVDPPRAGLHPKVTERLAKASGDVLVYVACNPLSLGRDAAVLIAGGWRLETLWTVDLFPQTGHIEAVGRFVRDAT